MEKELANPANFTTEYREQARKQDVKRSEALHKFYQEVTTAGKPEYLPRPDTAGQIITPEDLQ